MAHAIPKVRIIVVFGDISGFTEFCDAVTNDEAEYDPFMAEYDELVKRAARETGYDFTNTGDGFMCAVDIEAVNCSDKVCDVLTKLFELLQKIYQLIERKKRNPPAPSGYRMVGDAGYVKQTWEEGRRVLRGRPINRAHNYLEFARGKGFVCRYSLKQLINPRDAKRYGIKFKPLGEWYWILTVKPRKRRKTK